MNNGFLSQEEIDLLLGGGGNAEEEDGKQVEIELTDLDKDLLGEIGNISMGSASTALSTIINQQVNITTPVVTVTTLSDLKDTFEVPNVALEVKYTSGIVGENLLVMKVTDAAVVANLMMGGDGKLENATSLSELEESAVSEAMNQMIGSAATSMATMFGREVNISPPVSRIWDDLTSPLSNQLSEDEPIVKVSFSLNIGTLVDSNIMQLLPIKTARKIVSIMMGNEEPTDMDDKEIPQDASYGNHSGHDTKSFQEDYSHDNDEIIAPVAIGNEKPIEVQQAVFQPLTQPQKSAPLPSNIDLIMDVPLEISVVLGRTKLNIREILNLGTGSLIELDRLAEEPVEILVNGKRVAYGEVVVVDENFGVRITNIISNEEKIRSLGK
ncbi:flagellar motor switch phosphatase FliY [Clostridium sp. MSJ-11]|uniref:Flagellar motor switch phosphatase FliY n=1 Tax=Clostridium mobile TaxID=2841512 RepID=A0ABS6EDJ0_9CLOT|nr:flagellar motor switch phosphatase FliY [Clostridium mobile]MBU5483080.1 flagellar motor switch phosphatase FliY [Clostridium mobile]